MACGHPSQLNGLAVVPHGSDVKAISMFASRLLEGLQQVIPTLLTSAALDIPLRQRAKFEGWLKIELAAALAGQRWDVRIEQPYATLDGKQHRADIGIRADDGTEILLMLKTVNTSFRFDGVKQASRPITQNIQGVIADVRKLHHLPEGKTGYVFFPVFPVSADLPTRQAKLARHLDIVMAVGVELTANEFVRREPAWGVAWYLAKVS